MIKKKWKLYCWILLISLFLIASQVISNSAKKYDGETIPYKGSSYDSYINLLQEEIIIFQKIGIQ